MFFLACVFFKNLLRLQKQPTSQVPSPAVYTNGRLSRLVQEEGTSSPAIVKGSKHADRIWEESFGKAGERCLSPLISDLAYEGAHTYRQWHSDVIRPVATPAKIVLD